MSQNSWQGEMRNQPKHDGTMVSEPHGLRLSDCATPSSGWTLNLIAAKTEPTAVPSGSVPAKLVITRNFQEFAPLWPRSHKCGEARCFAFQSAEMVELQCRTLATARQAEPLFVAALGQNGEPQMFVPFCIEHVNDYTRMVKEVRVLKFLDGGFCDYNAPVVFPSVAHWDERTILRLWQGMRRILPSFDIAILTKMPDRIADLPNPFSRLKTGPDVEFCHATTLSGTWDSLAPRLLNHNRLGRKVRGLERIGRMTFEMAETPPQYDIFLEVLLRQKSRRNLETKGYDSLSRPGYLEYLRQARSLLYPSGPICLFALRIDNTIVATHYAVVFGSRLIAQVAGMEGGQWSTYSLGQVLKYKIIEWCFAQGLEVFDLGYGDEPHKHDFCNVDIALQRAVIPTSLKGVVALRWRTIAQEARKRRVASWREMELAGASCSQTSLASPRLKHARRSLVLWPSPRRITQFLGVALRIGTEKLKRHH